MSVSAHYNKLIVLGELKGHFSEETFTGKLVAEGGVKKLLRYLSTPQQYLVAAYPATWGVLSKRFVKDGAFGFHAMIKLPGKRICEIMSQKDATSSWVAPEGSQFELRSAKGNVIEAMWQRHLELTPRYRRMGNFNSTEGFLHYIPIKNDCFTYVDRILKESGQSATSLKRYFENSFASLVATCIKALF